MKRILILFIFIVITTVTFVVLNIHCIPELKDINPPVVQIINPQPGAIVNGTVSVVVTATDDDEISEVRILIDGKLVFTAQSIVATFLWDTAPVADNLIHFVSAVAIDKTNNIGNAPVSSVQVIKGSSADPEPPLVTISNPVGGQLVSGLVPIVAEAQDNVEVVKVDFYIDGILAVSDESAPFEYVWDTANLVKGSVHTLFVRAFDENNNTSVSPTIAVTVNSNVLGDITPPVLTILYPPSGSVFPSDTTIAVIADAEDENGIDRVEFYVDGLLMATDSVGVGTTFRFDWNLQNYGDGLLHTLYAKAFDPAQNPIAALIMVTVNP